MPQASFATRADQIVGALRKKYRTPEQALKALGLLAQDEAPEPEAKPATSSRGAFARLVLRLATQLDPDDWRDLQPHLAALAGGSSEAADEDEPTSPMEREMRQADATDEPPPFAGRPRTGGAMDSGASLKRFEEIYPGAPRRDPHPAAPQRRPAKVPSKAAVDDFAARYPGAMSIKVQA